MNIIARAALYLYDGSQAAPIFPDKVGKPGRYGVTKEMKAAAKAAKKAGKEG